MAQRRGVSIDPRLLALYSGNSSAPKGAFGQTDFSAGLAAYQARRAQEAATKDWDPVLRPVEQIFNVLTAGSSGVQNAIDKGVKGGIEAGPIGAIGGTVGGLVNGFFASFNNDPKSENYMTGSKMIESVTDRFGNAYNPNYVDRQDNVDPALKAAVGFAADVALDPLTYVPGGIIASGLRGAFRAAKTATGLAKIGAAAKGIVEGVPDAYKLGKITNTVKPIGLKQWKEVRQSDKFTKLMKKSGLSEDLMFGLTAENGTQRFLNEVLPKLRETNGPDYLAHLTEESVNQISEQAKLLVKNYEKTTSGAEGVRNVTNTAAGPEGAAAYLHPAEGASGSPVLTRESASARADAIRTRFADEKALNDLEIMKLDAVNSVKGLTKQLDELNTERAALEKLVARADRRAANADKAAKQADALAQAEARIAELDNGIKAKQLEIRRATYALGQAQSKWDEVAARNGVEMPGPADLQSLAAHLDKATTYMAIKGLGSDGVIGLATPAHRALLSIDRELGVTDGGSQVLLHSLHVALKNGIIDDVPLGFIGGKQVTLNDLIETFYGTGRGALPRNLDLSQADTVDPYIDFYSAVIDGVLYRMWDIVGGTNRELKAAMAASAGRLGSIEELTQQAVSHATESILKTSREIIASGQARLAELDAMPIHDQTLFYAERERLTASVKAAEDNVRFIENGGPENMSPYVVLGAFDAARESARIAGDGSAEYTNAVLQDIGTMRRALESIKNSDAALEVQTGAIADALSKLIIGHSATAESVARINALIGDGDNSIKTLIDVLIGTHTPLEAGISDPATFGKLIIEVAKLPIELPGISDVARLRARAFADAETMGVFAVEAGLSEKAVTAYGKELLRAYEAGGGVFLEETGQAGYKMDQVLGGNADELNDIVNRQATAADVASEVYDPNAGKFGFGMGGATEMTRGEGAYGAFDLFGNLVARGRTREELLRNLEIYRGATMRQLAASYTDSLEAAILGRVPSFTGETVDEFLAFWKQEYDQIMALDPSANIFNTAADAAIRGKNVPLHKKRIIQSDNPADWKDKKPIRVIQSVDENGNPINIEEKADSWGTLLRLDGGELPKNLPFEEGGKYALPVNNQTGIARADEVFANLEGGRTLDVPISEHVLGYAKTPLDINDWIRTIQIIGESKSVGGNFYARYRAVAEKLGIPVRTFELDETPVTIAALAIEPKIRKAYESYLESFKGAPTAEKAAGLEIRLAEWKASEGGKKLGQKEYEDLKSASMMNYGVDPLGRIVADAKTVGNKSRTAHEEYAWSVRSILGLKNIAGSSEDPKSLSDLVLKAKRDVDALKAVEKHVRNRTEAINIQNMLIAKWGELGLFGYTPESAKSIIDMRSAIAGSPIGIRTALEQMLPDITISREHEKTLAQAIDEARAILSATHALDYSVQPIMRASELLQPRVRFESVVNRPVIESMADPNSELGQLIRDFGVRWDPVKERPIATRKGTAPRDEAIGGEELVLKKEVRDWVTGGIKEVNVKDQNSWATYTSFDEVAVKEAMALLGLPENVARDVVLEMASRARALTDKETGVIKVAPEKYSNELIAAARKVMAEHDAKWVRPAEAVGNKASIDGEALFTKPKYRKLLEKVLEIAPYHNADVLHGDVYLPQTSWFEQYRAKNQPKPVTSLKQLIDKLELIKGRHYGSPESGLIEKMNGAEEVARLLQIDDAGHSNLIAATVNAKNVTSFFTQKEKDLIEATKTAGDNILLAGDEIVAAGQGFDLLAHTDTLARSTEAAKNVAMGASPAAKLIAAALDVKMRGPIRDSIAAAVEKARGMKGYSGFGADVERSALYPILKEIDRAGIAAKLSPEDVARLKNYALQIAREESHKMGLSPITSLAGNNVGRVKYSLNANSDWAYIGYLDVVGALRASGLSSTAIRLLTEMTGEAGLTFPSSVVAEMGVLSMKLNEAGLSHPDAAVALYYAIVESIRSIPKGRFDHILAGVDVGDPLGINAARFAEFAKAISDPRVAQKLREAHIANGTVAYARAGEISRKIAEPIITRIMNIRSRETASLTDIIKTIAGAAPAIREKVTREGVAADALAGYLAKIGVQDAVNRAFTPTEINIATHSTRLDIATKNAIKLAEYRAAASAERARLAARRIKLADEIVSRETAIFVTDLLKEPTDENILAAYDAAISQLEGDMRGSEHLVRIFMGGPEYAQAVDSAKAAVELKQAELDAIAGQISELDMQRLAAKGDIKGMRAMRATAERERLLAMRGEFVSAARSKSKITQKHRFTIEMLDAEIERLQKMIDEIDVPGRNNVYYDGSKLASDTARETLGSYADTGSGARAAQAFSLREGKEDAWFIPARGETAMDNNINNYEALLERLQMGILKAFGITAKRVPERGFEGADAVRAAKALDWGNNLMRRLIVQGESIESIVKSMATKEEKDLAIEFHKLASYILDKDSNVFIRAGLDADHINKYIVNGPFGSTKAARLDGGLVGRKLHADLVLRVEQLLNAGTGTGGADWLTLLKGYSWSFQRAAQIPNMAAEFSARFGHKAEGLSLEQATEAGYKAITRDGTLASWLDPNQLYPPHYLRQLANIERYLDSNITVNNKFIKVMDKVTGAIKSSVTLWRPGHHVVNVMGELLMNAAAGVFNPARYAQAWRTLKSVGEFDAGHIAGHNYDIPLDDFMNSYKLDTFTGPGGKEGVTVTLAGKQRTIPFSELYRMLNEKGILLNNNTAEDIIMQGDNIMGSHNRLGGIMGDLQRANEGLGAFSARRDNLFRIAHAIDIISRRPHRSLSSMLDDVSINVMEYHPTMQMLAPFERKYMRRAMYFYTWQRNAISVIFRTMFENPAHFTLPSKFIYEASTIGGEPESIGHPMPNLPTLSSWAAANNLGPHWINDDGKVYGFTLNAPQLDVLSSVLGSLYIDPAQDPMANFSQNANMLIRQNTMGQINPLAGTAAEYLFNAQYSDTGARTVTDWGDYLIDKTGLGYLSKATGIGLINNQGFLAPRSNMPTPEEQGQAGINALTGLRFTEWAKWDDAAQRERTAREKIAQDELARKLGIIP